MPLRIIFDFLSARGESVVHEWAKKLGKRDRVVLDQKLDLLQKGGPNNCPGLVGPVNGGHVYKLKAKGNVMLRPMLCKGPPQNKEHEYTLLLGAIEKDSVLIPEDAIQRADENRRILVADPGRRRQHEEFE
jgi:hypothetical protein